MNKTAVLVVDDEPQIRKLLRTGLASYGYEVNVVANAREALETLARDKPNIVVLDLNLGAGLDGLDVCRELRGWSATPIIMLTVNDDKQTRLAALNAGADDYITKPFDMEELEARIRAVLRRSAAEQAHTLNGEVRARDLVIDMVKRRVMLKGEEVHLTPTEYKLLCALATHPGKVLTFHALLEEITGDAPITKAEHYVRVYVNTLRKKLRDDSANTTRPLYIHNEPGVGYRFTDVQDTETRET